MDEGMKPKLIIPPRRPKTPEQLEIEKHLTMINDLYIRWINKSLQAGDDFLIIRHYDQLVSMKQTHDWQMDFDRKHYEWKVAQSGINLPKDTKSTK